MSPGDMPAGVVQRQVEAYNARDIDAFCACFSDDVQAWRLPALEPSISGKARLREFYATQRFNRPGLHATIVGRTVLGNKVVDHERIAGLGEAPVELLAVYEVSGGLIQRAWFFSGA